MLEDFSNQKSKKWCQDSGYEDFSRVKIPRKYFNFGPRNYDDKPISPYLKKVYDIASTIVNVLRTCGIDDFKAKISFDVITFVFYNFRTDCQGRIHVPYDQLMEVLRQDCCMTKSEAKLTCRLIKSGFKVLMTREIVKQYDIRKTNESEWDSAIEQTIKSYVKTEAPKAETELTLQILSNAYENYLQRCLKKTKKIFSEVEKRRKNSRMHKNIVWPREESINLQTVSKNQGVTSFPPQKLTSSNAGNERNLFGHFFICPAIDCSECSNEYAQNISTSCQPINLHICNHERRTNWCNCKTKDLIAYCPPYSNSNKHSGIKEFVNFALNSRRDGQNNCEISDVLRNSIQYCACVNAINEEPSSNSSLCKNECKSLSICNSQLYKKSVSSTSSLSKTTM